MAPNPRYDNHFEQTIIGRKIAKCQFFQVLPSFGMTDATH